MKILIAGGHLTPALAVIEKLKNHQIFYVGRKHPLEGDSAVSLEYEELEKLNVPFYDLKTARLQRKFTKYTILSLLKFPLGILGSIKILQKIKPDVLVGFGGYISVPLVLSAKLLNIPSVIHEQTFNAGLANRILSKVAVKVCISWESSRIYFPKEKTVLTGIPIKKELIEAKNAQRLKSGLPLLYITGGSLGSHTINQLVSKSLNTLLKTFIILHQTGDSKTYKDHQILQSIKENLPTAISSRYTLKKFLSPGQSADAIGKADIVVSRAGINTVCELLYLEKPSYLIPISFSQGNEQFKNALFIKESGLSEIGDEKLLTPDEFVKKISTMYKNIDSYKLKKKNIYGFESASSKIVEVIENVAKKTKN